jgi:hypothetical protein
VSIDLCPRFGGKLDLGFAEPKHGGVSWHRKARFMLDRSAGRSKWSSRTEDSIFFTVRPARNILSVSFLISVVILVVVSIIIAQFEPVRTLFLMMRPV